MQTDDARRAVGVTKEAYEEAQRALLACLEDECSALRNRLTVTIPAATAAAQVRVAVLGPEQLHLLPTRQEWNIICNALTGLLGQTVVMWDAGEERIGLRALSCGGDYSGGRIVLCGPRASMTACVHQYADNLGKLLVETRRVRERCLPEETVVVVA